MAKKSRGTTYTASVSASNMTKARMLEKIVASMHEREGVSVERNVRLLPASGKGEKREIDVLISSNLVGYPVRFAVECKNYNKPIGVEIIEAFLAKLDYVGIPRQQGIFVSTSGYTRGARERADDKDARLKLFTLDDALRNLDPAIVRAVQSVVFLLPVVGRINIRDFELNPRDTAESEDIHVFRDAQGTIVASVPDLVWRAWCNGDITDEIGSYTVPIEIPDDTYQLVAGKLVRVVGASVEIQVAGLIHELVGEVTAHGLRTVPTGELNKTQVHARFQPPASGRYKLVAVTSEEELSQRAASPAVVRVTNRLRLPRINYWNAMYWPPSARATQIVVERLRAFEAGLGPDPRPFNIAEIEGADLNTIFDSIDQRYDGAYPFLAPNQVSGTPQSSMAPEPEQQPADLDGQPSSVASPK
jgi:hypothetical protein